MCRNVNFFTRASGTFTQRVALFVNRQASDVSRTRGVSLLARPGNSLVAAIRNQSQQEPVPLGKWSNTERVFITYLQSALHNTAKKKWVSETVYRVESFVITLTTRITCVS